MRRGSVVFDGHPAVEIVVRANLRNYNKARLHGWVIAWGGNDLMCFVKERREHVQSPVVLS